MKGLLEHADEIPVTLVVALAYVTLAILTPTNEHLDRYGWLMPTLAADGEPWRMLTSAFLHGGFLHLGFNLIMLLQIGPMLERSLGSLRFVVLYVVSAVGGNIGVCLVNDVWQPVVGGSGALFGMMGALVAMNMRSGRHLFSFLDFEGPRRLLGLIAVNLVIGWLLPFVSNTSHVGGLVSGFGVTFLWLVRAREPSQMLWRWRIATAALFASLLFASLVPVTRFDWLHRQAKAANPSAQPALRRAAAMAYSGRASVTDTGAAAVAVRIDADLALARGR